MICLCVERLIRKTMIKEGRRRDFAFVPAGVLLLFLDIKFDTLFQAEYPGQDIDDDFIGTGFYKSHHVQHDLVVFL